MASSPVFLDLRAKLAHANFLEQYAIGGRKVRQDASREYNHGSYDQDGRENQRLYVTGAIAGQKIQQKSQPQHDAGNRSVVAIRKKNRSGL